MDLTWCPMVLLATAAAATVADDTVVGPRQGPWRRLFLDDTHIAGSDGVRRVFHRARKHADNPIITKTMDWEGYGPFVHGTVFREGNRLRLWHFIYSGKYVNGYAESADGLNWTKPVLGVCEYNGSRENNLVLTDPNETALALNLSVIRRDWVSNPAARYIAFFNSLAPKPCHPCFATSPDGIHWTLDPDGPKGLRSGDEMRVFYDPYVWRYVATRKGSRERRGRAVGVAVSRDGIAWRNLNSGEPVVFSLETGKQANQIYDMVVFAYQGLYLGLPNTYHAGWPDHGPPVQDKELGEAEKGTPTTLEIELAWSRDLTMWHRPPDAGQNPFIELGPEGAFDSGCIMGVANAPVLMDDELWFYYGGWDGPHRSWTRQAAVGLATLRLDGFVSIRAGAEEGWLLTPPEPLRQPMLTVNAAVGTDGYVTAELVDEAGTVVPGFGRKNCKPVRGDSVRGRIVWQPDATLPATKRCRVRFVLRNADLYSYLPE